MKELDQEEINKKAAEQITEAAAKDPASNDPKSEQK